MTIRTMYQKTGLTALQTVVIGGAASVSLCVGGIVIQETAEARSEQVVANQQSGLGSPQEDPNIAPESSPPPVDPATIPAPAPEPPSVVDMPPPPPVSVPVDDNVIRSPFEYRYGVNPLLPADYPELHNGIDFAGSLGDPVRTVKAGTVIYAQWHNEGGGGLRTIIDHGDGTFSTYNHQNNQWVTPGQYVEAGQDIGEVGSTGNSTGPHLHFELMIGWNNYVDPAPYMEEWNK